MGDRVMLKDANYASNANNTTNNTHNSYTGRAMTAFIINYHVARHSVCVSLMRTMFTPQQLTIKLCLGLVHAQCITVTLCTSILSF